MRRRHLPLRAAQDDFSGHGRLIEMDELALTSERDQTEPSGTKVGKFLANRGVIIIKEI
jgi:hypothetical protein